MRPKLATTDCAAENCVRPTEWVDDSEHIFAGYGWFARYLLGRIMDQNYGTMESTRVTMYLADLVKWWPDAHKPSRRWKCQICRWHRDHHANPA